MTQLEGLSLNNFVLDGAAHSEMTSVMGFDRINRKRPTSDSTTFFNPRNLIDRRPKQRISKLKLAGKVHGIPQGTKSPRISTFWKHIRVFEYMGKESPRSFVRSDKKILLSGIMEPISTVASEAEIREEIVAIVRRAEEPGYNLRVCDPTDFQFIQVSGKSATVPNVRSGFAWTGDAVKSLAGQGAVYVHLTKDFSIFSVSDGSDSSDDLIHVSLVSVCELLFVWIFEIYNSVCANVP